MTKNSLIYLEHINACIQKITDYTNGMDEASFLKDSLKQDAVIRNFEIIGEAAKQVDDDFRLKYPHIEWKKLAGMRYKLIHGYIGVDLWLVWAVVEHSLPDLKKQITEILNKERKV
jgi:uncharacterized protein with HEPN domain